MITIKVCLRKPEEWRPLIYYNRSSKISKRYLISSYGSVYDKIKDREVSTRYPPPEYRGRVKLTERDLDIRTGTFATNILVATAFIPNPDNLPVVNHLSGNPSNDYFENLEWTTYHGNTMHAIEYGLIKSPIKYAEVHEVCAMMTVPGWRYDDIMLKLRGNINKKEYNKFYRIIREIYNGKKYRTISRDYNIIQVTDGKCKESDQAIHEICKLLKQGLNAAIVSKQIGCSYNTVRHIRDGNSRRDISQLYFKFEN